MCRECVISRCFPVSNHKFVRDEWAGGRFQKFVRDLRKMRRNYSPLKDADKQQF